MSYGFCSKLISYAFQQCKNFENPLRSDKVTESLKVETFLRHKCSIYETEHPFSATQIPP